MTIDDVKNIFINKLSTINNDILEKDENIIKYLYNYIRFSRDYIMMIANTNQDLIEQAQIINSAVLYLEEFIEASKLLNKIKCSDESEDNLTREASLENYRANKLVQFWSIFSDIILHLNWEVLVDENSI